MHAVMTVMKHTELSYILLYMLYINKFFHIISSMQLICIRHLVEVGETKLRRIRQNQKI